MEFCLGYDLVRVVIQNRRVDSYCEDVATIAAVKLYVDHVQTQIQKKVEDFTACYHQIVLELVVVKELIKEGHLQTIQLEVHHQIVLYFYSSF
jgi:hypothetical protein